MGLFDKLDKLEDEWVESSAAKDKKKSKTAVFLKLSLMVIGVAIICLVLMHLYINNFMVGQF